MVNPDLIKKFFRGECSEEEAEVLRKYLDNESWAKRELDRMWRASNDTTIDNKTTNRNLKEIRRKAKYTERTITRIQDLILVRVAAIVLLAFVLPLIVLDLNNPDTVEEKRQEFITKTNPSGQKSRVFLPDGSVVKLNAGSSIRYLEGFSPNNREVVLTGEAFFEVAEDSDRPFLVITGDISTKALGTSFNVKAFEGDDHIEVVLASGQVEVSSSPRTTLATLLPGEEVVYHNHYKSHKKQKADLKKALAWTNNQIVFDHASAEEIFTYLERWYGVEFVVDQEVSDKSWHFSGCYKDESLKNILLSLSYVKSFNFEINNKTAYITP